MPQDADVEKARQEHEAKDERHAGELKTVKDGYEAEMKAKDEQHAEELGNLREAKVSGDLLFVCGCT